MLQSHGCTMYHSPVQQIQRFVRGMQARRTVALRRKRFTLLAVVCQGMFWANRAKQAVLLRQHEVHKERTRAAKDDHRAWMRVEHERLVRMIL